MTRRSALQLLPAALPAPAPLVRLGCQTNAWPIDPRDFSQFLAVLGRIRSLGFTGFETTFRNVVPQAARLAEAQKEIAAAGLAFLGLHIFLGRQYDPETGVAPWKLAREVADLGAALGAERLILSGAAKNKNGKVDAATLARKTEALNRAGAYCARRRLSLAYHNHNLEFQGGGEEMERLLEQTDPGTVGLMLDAGHAFVGGVDAVAFFERRHARIRGMHLRDFKLGRQAPLGRGEFDFGALARAVHRVRWRGWIVAEEERPNDVRPGDSVVKPARGRLRKVFGL